MRPLLPHVAVFVIACAIAGCRGEAAIESMTLYSIDGDVVIEADKPHKGETFHLYPVLGKTDIVAPDDRRAILAAVKQGIAEGNPRRHIMCFWPHHAVSLVQNGKTIDYVICFHCLQIDEFTPSGYKHAEISNAAADLLNAHLKRAGVSLKE